MFFNKIHHIAIICSNYERSRYFYTKILGLKIINETYREVRGSYKLDLKISDNIQLELFSFPVSPKRNSYPESCGLRHLSFTVANLANTIKYLNENDIICEEIRYDELTGKAFTFFTDPDDLPLELYEE